jgi:redox-regulated HSP33 family molecular chaperone
MKNNKSLSERRLIENELVFKQVNEKIKSAAENLLEVKELQDTPIEFYCECSDPDCHQQILMTPEKYEELHQNRKRFIVKPNHETKKVEQVVKKEPYYLVVEK